MKKINNTTSVPGESFAMEANIGAVSKQGLTVTAATGRPRFSTIRHLLSGKPLRRPNRAKPIH